MLSCLKIGMILALKLIERESSALRPIEYCRLTCDDNRVGSLDPNANMFNWWRLTIVAKSFLHEQIRRMVGLLFAIAA